MCKQIFLQSLNELYEVCLKVLLEKHKCGGVGVGIIIIVTHSATLAFESLTTLPYTIANVKMKYGQVSISPPLIE